MSAPVMGPTRKIASFVEETCLADVPQQAVDTARLLVLDTLGVALAAVREPIGRHIIEHVQSLGGTPTSTVLGAGHRTSAPLAALANGTLAHALDFDDGLHLGTHTLPAALAVGEQIHASGRDVLEAFIVGREVGTRVMEAIDALRKQQGGPTYRGWYHVGICGPIAAAVSAAKLLRLDAAAVAMAIGIAATSGGGLRRNQGTMAKALHSGNAASDGVQAAFLAQRGFTADPEILEAPRGLFNALCLPGECDLEPIMAHLGQPFELERPMTVKAYPACTPAHKPIEAALVIRSQYDFSVDDVESIEADLHTFSLQRPEPQDGMEAGFSMPYLLAVALVDGQLGLDQVAEERVHDPRVRALMERVVATPANAPDDEPERVTVRLRDGRSLTAEVAAVRRLRTHADIEAKYRDCAGRALPVEAAERLYEQVMDIERLDDISTLMATAAGSQSPTAGASV